MGDIKLLAFSDLHSHNHKRYAKTDGLGMNTRLLVAIRALQQTRKLGEKLGITTIVFAGDLFDAKGKVPVVVLNKVFEEFVKWQGIFDVIMIPGNHDFATRSGGAHALEIFDELEGFKVVHRPEKFTFGIRSGAVLNVTAVPYRDRMKDVWFRPEPTTTICHARVCIAHGFVNGCKLSKDSVFDDAMIADHQGGKIPPAWLEEHTLSIVGHIHYPQRMARGKNVLIPGQPYQGFPQDVGQERGVWEVTIKDGGKVSAKIHELNLPKFVRVIHRGPDPSGVGQVLETEGGIPYFKFKGNIVLIQPESHSILDNDLLAARIGVENQGAEYVEVLPPPLKKNDKRDVPRVEVDSAMEPNEVVSRVLRSGHVDLGGFEPEDLHELASELLKEAQEQERDE